MGEIIVDGTGVGSKLRIDKNFQAHTFSITESESSDALDKGNAFNINTGWVNISATTGMLYFQNGENSNYVIETFVIGFKQGATTDQPYIEILRNPTAGTTVSSANDAPIISNSDFSSPNSFGSDTLIYAGADSETITGGAVHAVLGGKLDSRGGYGVKVELSKGSSVGVRVYPDLSAGNVDVYVALIGYMKDENNKK
jgi:hypothetical protein